MHIETAVHCFASSSRRLRKYPELQIAIGQWASATVHAVQGRRHADVDDRPRATDQRLSQRKCSLHFAGFNFTPTSSTCCCNRRRQNQFSADTLWIDVRSASVPGQAAVSPADREKIATANAERLFRM